MSGSFSRARRIEWKEAVCGRFLMMVYNRSSLVLSRLLLLALLFVFAAAAAHAQLPASANAPKVGEKAPDFTLPAAQGNSVKLSELYSAEKGQWALLVFYRGYW
jgi:cytochrome oxidase Cu insertion factor (SCO1/SenC/PrrC family)